MFNNVKQVPMERRAGLHFTCSVSAEKDTKTGEAFVSCASGKEKPTQYESEVDSESDSESDYEDEKETVGGSEAVECAYSFGYF
ncbi:uncharacterized protein PITG_07677 [Phytophthora infestans T30-4]|uniref:Uncharacterized protein n=1 Tax=Phytophthora infestans (strain T30-4) TaxID=403677 RepID=D0N8V8_PHYIT|nr:uncharacterized protein PITG_07677 [Phytophthora infestans T30-4]EEY53993.1 hypothetical protein PITG_07677 [Phytophthora infestans T30-4]|eukprot:XP_002904624.1 hypothetical protein PITG_07677 [Phytophthora infestans T30-4]